MTNWEAIDATMARVREPAPWRRNGLDVDPRQFYRTRLANALAEYDDGRAVLAKMRPARAQQWQAEMLGLITQAARSYLEHGPQDWEGGATVPRAASAPDQQGTSSGGATGTTVPARPAAAPGVPVQVKPARPCRAHNDPWCFCSAVVKDGAQ